MDVDHPSISCEATCLKVFYQRLALNEARWKKVQPRVNWKRQAKREAKGISVNLKARAKRKSQEVLVKLSCRARLDVEEILVSLYFRAKREA